MLDSLALSLSGSGRCGRAAVGSVGSWLPRSSPPALCLPPAPAPVRMYQLVCMDQVRVLVACTGTSSTGTVVQLLELYR